MFCSLILSHGVSFESSLFTVEVRRDTFSIKKYFSFFFFVQNSNIQFTFVFFEFTWSKRYRLQFTLEPTNDEHFEIDILLIEWDISPKPMCINQYTSERYGLQALTEFYVQLAKQTNHPMRCDATSDALYGNPADVMHRRKMRPPVYLLLNVGPRRTRQYTRLPIPVEGEIASAHNVPCGKRIHRKTFLVATTSTTMCYQISPAEETTQFTRALECSCDFYFNSHHDSCTFAIQTQNLLSKIILYDSI